MPNWCYNSLLIEGSEEDIKSIKEQVSKPFTQEHENFDMDTREMAFKEYSYTNPVFAFWNIIKPTDMETYRLQKDPKQDPNVINFAGDNWYDWNVRNWGTKWDVAVHEDNKYPDTELTDESAVMLHYSFNTAWSPPIEVITELSRQYPNAEITLSYEEETGWGGEHLFVDGQGSEIESYENKCRDCDATNTLEYCDNDCGEICLECNYLGEADMEAVAECEVHKVLI